MKKMNSENSGNTLDSKTQLGHCKQAIKELTEENKELTEQLRIDVAMHRRELLIAFFDSVDYNDIKLQRNAKGWKVVDNYLQAIDLA